MPLFQHDGRRTAYLDTAAAGSARAAAAPRPTLLLLHAFPMNAGMWTPQLAAAPPGWRFIAPDFRGFGESDTDRRDGPPVTIDDYARDALALVGHLGVERFVVAGLSMGGYAAFALLRLAASRVAGLVLADTKAEADDPPAREARQEMVTLVGRQGVNGVVEAMVPRLLGERTRRERPAVVQRVRTIAAANTVEGIEAALKRMMRRPDSSNLLAAIDCPTLVIVGAEDAPTPPAQARAMCERIPGARRVEIPGAGHLSNLEQPDAFNAALLDFLASFPEDPL